MNHKEIIAELRNLFPTSDHRNNLAINAIRIIEEQAKRLDVIDGVDVVARQQADIEARCQNEGYLFDEVTELKARVAELEGSLDSGLSSEGLLDSGGSRYPVAWMRSVRSGAHDMPPDYDVELCEGDDRPRGDGWAPLYTAPPSSAGVRNQALEEAANAAKAKFHFFRGQAIDNGDAEEFESAANGAWQCYTAICALKSVVPAVEPTDDPKPRACSSDPTSCPDNDGHGCWCNRAGQEMAPQSEDAQSPGACSACGGRNMNCGHCDGTGLEPRKITGYGDCKCVLSQYCDGTCNPIFADQVAPPSQGEDARDAARYRWLTYAGWIDDAIMKEHGIVEGISETLDAAIDTAMQAEGKKS